MYGDRYITTEESGRYTEIYISGVEDGSVAVDFGTEPPELIVSQAGDEPTRRIELPAEGEQ